MHFPKVENLSPKDPLAKSSFLRLYMNILLQRPSAEYLSPSAFSFLSLPSLGPLGHGAQRGKK